MDAQIDEIKRTLQLLFKDGDTTELRAVGNRTVNGFYRDREKLAADAHALNNHFKPLENCYVCLNPVQPELFARRADAFAICKKGEAVGDKDVACRRWLLVDIDPVRASGVSATNEQKQAAIELAKRVYTWLQDQLGGACLVCADSGNGSHILIRLPDLPNSSEVAWVCDRFLQLLADRFSNELAKVDTTTSNAARICTVYGTAKRKGSDIPEQPHRLSRLLHIPDPLTPVDWARLTALVDHPYPGDQPPASQPSGTGEAWQIEQLLQDRQIEYTASEDTSNSGERWRKYEMACPFSAEHSDGFALFQWDSGAIAAKCHHDGCAGKGWQELKRIWQLPDSEGITAADIILPAQPQLLLPQSELLIVRSQDVQPEQVDWLWHERFVVGGINLCCGRGGIGKTFFLCDLVARITNDSLTAPNGQPLRHGRVLYSTGEDHIAKIIEPRMQAHGADRNRLEYIKGLPAGDYVQLLDVLRHADALRDAISQRPDTIAIVLDPISSFQGGADSNKVSEVRRFTAVLTQLSEEFDIAVLGIHHFNKGKRDVAGDSISGSHAYRDAARAIWLFALDADDRERRLMVCDKNNWAAQHPDGLAYRISGGRIDYEPDPLLMTSDELLGQPAGRPVDIAISWLSARLSTGRQPAIDMQAAAALENISDRTLQRAKKKAGVQSVRDGELWYWQLPDNAAINIATSDKDATGI